jgi:hypothetical protein
MSDISGNITTNDQENIFKFEKFNFKDIETNVYTLKINSKSRNLILEPNPFNFELTFNENPDSKYKKAIIPNKFDHIKKIQVAQILVPRFIPREYMGEPFNGITPIYNTDNTITLSYYPGININNTIINVIHLDNTTSKVEVLELVDLNNKKIYLVAIQYNNPYYLSKYINIKTDIYSYLNINDNIYPITNITGTMIELGNTTNFSLPLFTNNRLIIGDYYKNITFIDTVGDHIQYGKDRKNNNIETIFIFKTNYLNYQYIFPGQYLEYLIVNESDKSYVDRKLFKITNIIVDLINKNLPQEVNNTIIKFAGIWTDGYPNNYVPGRLLNVLNPGTSLRLSQFNFGIRDLLDDKIFYLSMLPFVPNRLVATEQEINDTFGVFFPSTQSKDYLYLRGDAFENYSYSNLQTTNNKIKFTLLDSNYEQVGTVYSKYFNLYKPSNNMSVKSYLPNIPDVTIIMKIEQIERRNIIQPFV